MASPNRSPIRVMQLDDHPIVRHGAADSLSREADIEVVGSFTTSRELMNALRTTAADVLLIDYALGPGDIDGVNLIRALRIRFSNCLILVASGHYNPATVSLALRAGAHGFVGKTQAVDVLAKAIRAVAAGRRYLDPSMASELDTGDIPLPADTDTEDESMLTRHAHLSPREREVLRCFLDGMSVSQIAEKFSRNVNTISTQKQAALRKLGIRSDNELFKIRHLIGDA
jgi:two-component system capsular synthesis response regulator RcsB